MPCATARYLVLMPLGTACCRAASLEYLGSHFRLVLDQPSRCSDYQVGVGGWGGADVLKYKWVGGVGWSGG